MRIFYFWIKSFILILNIKDIMFTTLYSVVCAQTKEQKNTAVGALLCNNTTKTANNNKFKTVNNRYWMYWFRGLWTLGELLALSKGNWHWIVRVNDQHTNCKEFLLCGFVITVGWSYSMVGSQCGRNLGIHPT